MTGILVLVGFFALVLTVVMLDLGVFHRHAREVRVREAMAWTCAWVTLALLFTVFVYFLYEHNLFDWKNQGLVDIEQLYGGVRSVGRTAAVDFLTGYLVEVSLSLDNVFVIALILAYFRVPLAQQHRVLFWGIMGAVVLRGVMIWCGVELVERFNWIMLLFGVFLIFSGVKMAMTRHEDLDPEHNFILRLTRRILPVTHEFHGSAFFTRAPGRLTATPLFLALVLVESTDVMFAVDSVPAIIGITQDRFLVYTSNVFAIFGLRSMYFALSGMLDRFRYLKGSLCFLLAFIGVKMLVPFLDHVVDMESLVERYPVLLNVLDLKKHDYHIRSSVSLAVIAGALVLGVLMSLLIPRREAAPVPTPPDETPPADTKRPKTTEF